MPNTLKPGDVRVGHILEAEDDSPWQAAVLTFSARSGANLQLPYVVREPQFASVERWFGKRQPPATLVFRDVEGAVTLVGVRSRGSRGDTQSLGVLGATAAVFSGPRNFKTDYRVKEFRSEIDGLDTFAGFRPVNYETEDAGAGQRRVSVVVDPSEKVTWRWGGYTYRIQAAASWTGSNGTKFELSDTSPYLLTSKSKGATLVEHLEAHRSIRALLVMLHGEPASWRSHHVRDDQFVARTLSGQALRPDFVEVQLASTIEQHHNPPPGDRDLRFPAATLLDLGGRGMRRWCGAYGDAALRRAVDPAVEVINGATKFVEPQLMMLAMSLDRFGQYHHGDATQRRMSTNILRCIDAAELDWPELGDRSAIAKAISNLNNDLKHADRSNYPGFKELWCVNQLAKAIARAQVLVFAGAPERVRREFRNSLAVVEAGSAFARNGVVISGDGEVSLS